MSDLSDLSQNPPGASAITLALLQYRMTNLETSVKADVADLRNDIQQESRYTREALAKRDSAQITTLVLVILALVGVCAQLLIHVLPGGH